MAARSTKAMRHTCADGPFRETLRVTAWTQIGQGFALRTIFNGWGGGLELMLECSRPVTDSNIACNIWNIPLPITIWHKRHPNPDTEGSKMIWDLERLHYYVGVEKHGRRQDDKNGLSGNNRFSDTDIRQEERSSSCSPAKAHQEVQLTDGKTWINGKVLKRKTGDFEYRHWQETGMQRNFARIFRGDTEFCQGNNLKTIYICQRIRGEKIVAVLIHHCVRKKPRCPKMRGRGFFWQ